MIGLVGMSDTNQDAERVVCRLCTSTKPGQLQIFGEDGERCQLSNRIKRCLSIQVYVEDSLPKSVCISCVAKVEDFHEFQQAALRAQSILEKENLKQNKTEITEAAIVEAEQIVERLQAEGSALSITPVLSVATSKTEDYQAIINSPSALSITPIMHNSESSGDEDSQSDSSPSYTYLPRLKNPCSEDYILMQEETFKLPTSLWLSSKQNPIEFRSRLDEHFFFKDKDVLENQLMRRVVLPPMWDVYERSTDKENVTHRRYVVSKSSFPCSLCGACVAFQRQQSIHVKKLDSSNQENNLQTMLGIKQEPRDDRIMSLHDQQNQLEQQVLQDLRSSEFPPQEVGMLDCPECGKLFPRRSSWKRHLRIHYEGRAFLCPLCGKGFNRKEHLSRHMTSHTGGRPFRCETCFKPFTRKEHLGRHLACNPACGGILGSFHPDVDHQDHTVARPFTCDICFQSFIRKEHMLRHRKRAHLLVESCLASPPVRDEDDVGLYSCNICSNSYPKKSLLDEHFQIYHKSLSNTSDNINENETSPSSDFHDEDVQGGPEQIEVEVNLVEDCSDGDSTIDGDDLLPQIIMNSEGSSTLTVTQNQESDAGEEDIELDKEDRLRMQMNEALRKAREGCDASSNQAPRCEACLKSFTQKSHLIRHLRRFHPHVELAHTLSNVLNGRVPPEEAPQQHSFFPLSSSKDDNEADDECGSTLSSFPTDSAVAPLRGKGGHHPCSICGKMFGRRYHLVRHRRTQHGVESVKTSPVGRPPKRLSFSPHSQSSIPIQPFRCTVCGDQFNNHSNYCSHSCTSNNNIIGKSSGSRALAEMAAKLSDKLNRGKDIFEHACQSCGKKFCNKLELDKHIETHVNDVMEGMLWTQ